MNKWYIGQEIVAIEDHPKNKFKTGNIFIIKSLRSSHCVCDHILIDIGISTPPSCSRCLICGNKESEKTLLHWFNERRFAPLDELMNEAINEVKQELQI